MFVPSNKLTSMKHVLLPVAAFLVFFACKNPSQSGGNIPAQPDTTATSSVQVPADFEAFYEKFHQDSQFQMAHIVWPLQGRHSVTKDSTSSEVQPYTWLPGTWAMHHPIDYASGDYIRDLQMFSEIMVIERIRLKAYNYGLERRFARQPDTKEWALIYYSDMQEIGK